LLLLSRSFSPGKKDSVDPFSAADGAMHKEGVPQSADSSVNKAVDGEMKKSM
jgi:hypothetical protein